LDEDRRHKALEAALFKERAAGLGVAGSRLQRAIREYEVGTVASDQAEGHAAALLKVVAERAHELLLQRELNGFLHDNLEWLVKAYRIPEPVLRKLRANFQTHHDNAP
jgi:hypothetical protein